MIEVLQGVSWRVPLFGVSGELAAEPSRPSGAGSFRRVGASPVRCLLGLRQSSLLDCRIRSGYVSTNAYRINGYSALSPALFIGAI